MKMRLLSLASVAFAAASAGTAQTYEISPFVGMARLKDRTLGSWNQDERNDDDTQMTGRGPTVGLRLTINTPGYYAHEINYSRARADISTRVPGEEEDTFLTRRDRIPVDELGYNFLLYFMPLESWWRPHMTGGIQVHQYGVPNIPEWLGGKSRNLGANYGGGLKLRLGKHALMRIDARDYIGVKPYGLRFRDDLKTGGWTRRMEGSFGISAVF